MWGVMKLRWAPVSHEPEVLCDVGSFDFPHIQERSRRVSTLIRAGVGKEVPDAAHLPGLDQPEVISRLLVDFI